MAATRGMAARRGECSAPPGTVASTTSFAASAIGYAQIGGIFSTFVAPAAMGWVIERSGGSFLAAFGLFAGVELAVLGILLTLARDPAQLASKRLKSSF